jgi:hypothetical protein
MLHPLVISGVRPYPDKTTESPVALARLISGRRSPKYQTLQHRLDAYSTQLAARVDGTATGSNE